MRALFLLLLFVNLVFFGVQLDLAGDLVHERPPRAAQAPINADRLRIVRETPARPAAPAVPRPEPTRPAA